MTTVLAGGDSFTWGSELADQLNGASSNSTIPALLAQSIGADYVCAASFGNSNGAIARQVINACHAHRGADIFVFVMWTFTHRYEFRFNYNTGRRHSPWHSINLWDIEDDSNAAANSSYAHNKQLLENSGVADFARVFYKHVGTNEAYEYYSSLKEIVLLQNYLTVNGINFLFCPADNHFMYHESYNKYKHDVSIESLHSAIDWDKWFLFPSGSGPNQTESPRGFYQWAIENKYPVGQAHPLEQAHLDAANLMQEKFNEMVKKSV